MKWGQKYGPEFVNKLRSMVQRNLSLPHRFVCFTDDATGLRSDIEALPLPPMHLPPGKERGWRKLSTFAETLADLSGATLFLDIDVVITGKLDDFFSFRPGEFCIIRDWKKPWRGIGNSSVYRFEVGSHPEILSYFLANIDRVKSEVRHEQAYLSRELLRQKKLNYWSPEWCVSFKYGCMAKFPLNFFKTPQLPEQARIVVFHGNPNPDEARDGISHGFFRHVKQTPWIEEFWR